MCVVKKEIFLFFVLEIFFEKGGGEKNESLGDFGFIGYATIKSCCDFQTVCPWEFFP